MAWDALVPGGEGGGLAYDLRMACRKYWEPRFAMCLADRSRGALGWDSLYQETSLVLDSWWRSGKGNVVVQKLLTKYFRILSI